MRPQLLNENKGAPTFKNQDGAIVLIQCLDNIGDKAVVVGNLIHPDRPTTVITTDPYLQGEYNGVNVEVKNDGSTSLTFKGATDSQGLPTNPTQGDTKVSIEKDGSFQVDHKTVTFRLDKSGDVTINSSVGNVNVTSTTGNIAVNTTLGDVTLGGSLAKLKLSQGRVALGGPVAETLDIIDQTLAQLVQLTTAMSLETHIGNLGFPTSPPINAASYIAVDVSITLIRVLLATIKGTL
jgi:hypothetical protein